MITADDLVEQEYEAQTIGDAICATYGSIEAFKKFVHGTFIHDAEIEATTRQGGPRLWQIIVLSE